MYIIKKIFIAQLLDILLSALLVSDSFPHCPEDLLSSRLDDTESSHPCWLYPAKNNLQNNIPGTTSTCKIKLQNDTLLVTLKGMSQIL